jgi:hypothetical protein
MKNSIKLVINVCIFLGLIIPIFAKEEKIDKLIEDDTLKRYERKAIIFTKDIALETRKVLLPITYCYPTGRRRECINQGFYEYKIDENIEDKIEKLAYELIVSNRFDKILVEKSKGITMVLPTKTIKMENENIPSFSYDVGSYKNYQSSVNSFLSKLYQPIKQILIDTKNVRYEQMENKEKESFYVQKAKSSGLPVKFISKIMNSSFAFSLYVPKVSGSIRIDKQVIKKVIKNVVVYMTTYEAYLVIYFEPKLSIYRLNADNPDKGFVFYSTLLGSQGGSSSESFYNKPNKMELYELFESSILSASRASSKYFAYKLIKDNNFAIFVPVNSVSDNILKANIGVLEDLRVDAPYTIRKMVNSKVKQTGFAKARFVFDNIHKINKKVQPIGSSSFQVIQGSANIVSLMREHPWSGNFAFAGISVEKFNLDKIAGFDVVGSGNFPSFTAGVSRDLGFTLNKAVLSEVWVDMKISTGISDKFIIQDGDDTKMLAPLLIAVSGTMSKRFYISTTGLYVSPKVGIGYSTIIGSLKYDSSGSLRVNSYDVSLGIDTGYNMGPNKEIVFSLAYDISLANTKAKYSRSNIEFEAEVSRGLSFYLGYRHHIKSFN